MHACICDILRRARVRKEIGLLADPPPPAHDVPHAVTTSCTLLSHRLFCNIQFFFSTVVNDAISQQIIVQVILKKPHVCSVREHRTRRAYHISVGDGHRGVSELKLIIVIISITPATNETAR